ncbi:MAG: ethylbenzene dehydrogenase-related protein [Campylobacteraceae bacterium]|nr:ethylbenzene dehydrogenase-related protein [Campylobacteraceae bacterium]
MITKVILFIFIACFASANNYISAVRIPGNVLGIKATSKAWMSANFTNIKAYPYTGIKTNDVNANKLNRDSGVRNISVKVLYDGKNIAFLLKWKDSTKNIPAKFETDSFADGFGIELPKQLESIPYVNFGDKKNSVVFYSVKAGVKQSDTRQNLDEFENKNSITVKQDAYQYRKFSNSKKLNLQNSNTTADLIYKNGYWLGSLSKQIVDEFSSVNSGAFIVSFSLYNGQNLQRGRLRNLTPWESIKVEGIDGGEQLIQGISEQITADIKEGKVLMLKNCSICHNYKNVKKAPEYMAPNLSFIGGYGNLSYLRDSVLNPNRVQVEDFTKTAHPNFPWSEVNEDGKYISIMPSFDWMSQSELDNLLAFLQTLK